MAITVVFYLAITITGMKSAAKTTYISASPKKLVVVETWALGKQRYSMRPDQVQELVVGFNPKDDEQKSHCLLVQSDTQTLSLGLGLSEGELEWVRATLENGMADES